MDKELWLQVIYQAIGIIALCFTAFSYQFKDMKKLLITQCIGSVLWVAHFYLIGSYAACIMNVLCIARCIGYAFINNKNARWAFTGVICAAFIGAGVLSVYVFSELWFIAIITATASIAGNVFFSIGNNKLYKYVQLGFITPCWMFNNIWYMSIGGIICEVFNAVSVIVFIIRTSIKSKNATNVDQK